MLPEEFIPEAVLEKDKEFQRVVRKSKQCFARVECQSSWNSYQVRVAATPHNLHNDERSYWITVPPTALPTPMQGTTLPAEAIPDDLLLEDEELRSVALRDGVCWARVERQVDWDCYRVRIAAQQRYLLDKERSHLIFVTAMQLQGQNGDDQQILSHAETQIAKVYHKGPKTQMVRVSEADIRHAMGTMEPLVGRELPGKDLSRLPLKALRWIELMLFRAVLIALEYQRELQEAVRRVLVSRRRLGGRLISIKEVYEKDYQRYWIVSVGVAFG